MKYGSHHHTGKLHDHNLPMHRTNSVSGRDPHASSEFHSMNKKHGTPDGMHPKPGGGVHQEGGSGMAENCDYD